MVRKYEIVLLVLWHQRNDSSLFSRDKNWHKIQKVQKARYDDQKVRSNRGHKRNRERDHEPHGGHKRGHTQNRDRQRERGDVRTHVHILIRQEKIKNYSCI